MDGRTELSRRAYLRVLSTGLVAAAGALSTGCRREEAFVCTDTTNLSEPERAARTALKYVDRSDQSERRCDLCVQYEPSAKGASCGGCKVMRGPIHPSGSCLAWAAKG